MKPAFSLGRRDNAHPSARECASPRGAANGDRNHMPGLVSTPEKHLVALINASDDTVDMVQRMLGASGFDCLVGCRFADLKRGRVDFATFLSEHDPDVVIFDISPPYLQNWNYFKTLRDAKAMEGRGLVLTTTNKGRLDETTGGDSKALEIVGKPYDLDQIEAAIHAALKRSHDVRRPPRS
jgi:DNA-binding response OmpR family regulator